MNGPYEYPGTDVLINKAGIRNQADLDIFERTNTSFRAMELRMDPLSGKFDLEHLKAIHNHLFQDVYPFAGQIRTVNIGKNGFWFCDQRFIEQQAGEIFGQLKKDNFLRGLDQEAFANKAGYYYSEINVIHPFREGNGRSIREFFHQLSKAAGYELQWSQVPKEQYMEAIKATDDPTKLDKLIEVIQRCMRPVEDPVVQKWMILEKEMPLKDVLKLAEGLPADRGPVIVDGKMLNQIVERFLISKDDNQESITFKLKGQNNTNTVELKKVPHLPRDMKNQMLDRAAAATQPNKQVDRYMEM